MTKTRMHKAKSSSYKKFWTALRESREDADLRRIEADKRMKEMSEAADLRRIEADKRMKEMSEAADLRRIEVDKRMKEMSEAADLRRIEADKRMKEMSEAADLRRIEADKRMKEMSEADDKRRIEADLRRIEADKRRKAIDRQLAELAQSQKETDRRVGELTNRYGKISEHKVIPTLIDAFKSLGYDFSRTTQNVKVDDFEHAIHCQADAMLENNDCAIVVEVKTTLRSDDVADHIERMQKFRILANIQNDTRKYYGAIAGISIGRNEKTHALRKGFFVLEPVEETFVISIPARPGGVKAW
ncbi:hypothetical protein ACYULU_16120 [Breznakiellaceae bacterium SP9]